MEILNVDWQITSKCNRNCGYCFGPLENDTLSIKEIYKIIDNLYFLGVKQIGITGGEPLIHPYFPDIINYIYSLGIKIYLSTNCDFFFEYEQLIKEKISILGIPIDGSTSEIHDYHRGKGSFSNVMNVMNNIISSNNNLLLKIGTVVTNYNFKNLNLIEELLNNYNDKILFWKLYEIIIYEKNKKALQMKSNNLILQKDFGSYIDPSKIIFDTKEKRDSSYFFIKPNGDLFVPVLNHLGCFEKLLGNMLVDNPIDCIKRFEKNCNFNGYYANYRYMKV